MVQIELSQKKYEEPEEILDEEVIIDPEEIKLQKEKKLKFIEDSKIEVEDKQEEYKEFEVEEDIEEYTPIEE